MAKHQTVYASAARTATPTAVSIPTGRYRYLHLTMDITAVTATPALTITIDGLDPGTGKYYNLLTSTALATVSTTTLRVGPGLTNSANLIANDVLPSTIRITVTHGDADSATYSMGANLY